MPWFQNAISSNDNACGKHYHNLSDCDFPLTIQSNCTDTYMSLQKDLYLTICGLLFVIGVVCCGHLLSRINYILHLKLPKQKLRFPLSLYILSIFFCLVLIYRSIDVFGYAGVLSFVVVNTLEDIGTALQLAVFFRIALKWPSVGALKIKQRHACNNGDANHAFHRKCRCQCGNGTFTVLITILVLCTAFIGSYCQANVGVLPQAPYGTQSGLINAIKLYTFAIIMFIFMVGNLFYGYRVAIKVRKILAALQAHDHKRRRKSQNKKVITTAKKKQKPPKETITNPHNEQDRLSPENHTFETSTQVNEISRHGYVPLQNASPTISWQSLSQSSMNSAGSNFSDGSGSHNASNRILASGEFEDYEDSVCKDAGTIRSTYKVENRTGLDGGWCGDKKLRRMVFYITLSTCVAMAAMIYLLWAGTSRLSDCLFFQMPEPDNGYLSITSTIPCAIQVLGLFVFLLLFRSPTQPIKKKKVRA